MRAVNLLCAILLTLTHSAIAARSKPSNAVLLSTVKSLTLKDGALTTARRVKAIPQLTCTGSNAKGVYKVDSMRCTNTGSSYSTEDIEWTCNASLPPEFKLGSTEVICEGYDSPQDEYVLKGSCGVEYRLILTEMGEEKYGRPSSGNFYKDSGDAPDSPAFTALFWLVFVGIVGFLVYKIFTGNGSASPRARPNNNNFFGGSGGGGGGGDDDPPPPYTPRGPPKPKTYSTPRASQWSSQGGRQPDSWRPGFWSGAAAGGTAAYVANNFANRSRQRSPPRAGPSSWFGTGARREPSPVRGGQGWFGGGGGSSGGTGGGGFRSSAPAPSGSRYESSGFGGTRRR